MLNAQGVEKPCHFLRASYITNCVPHYLLILDSSSPRGGAKLHSISSITKSKKTVPTNSVTRLFLVEVSVETI
jgi:hypothetical protein